MSLIHRWAKGWLVQSRSGPLAIILFINLALRFAWLLYMHPPQSMDFHFYDVHAVRIAKGMGYITSYGNPTAYWPVGYPFFLSLVYRITGHSIVAGLAANALLSLVIVCFVYLITLQLTNRRAVAVAAAIGYTLLPSQIEWNAVLGSEELFTALAMAGVYAFLRAQGRPWVLVMAGVCMGFACDVRPVLLLLPFALFLLNWLVWCQSAGQAAAQIGWLLLGGAAAIAPVTVRNWETMHHLILISTNGGVNLWQGTHSNGAYFWPADRAHNPLLSVSADEVRKNHLGMHLALRHMLHHPFSTAGNGVLKLFFLYWVDWNVVSVTFAVTGPAWWVPVAMWGDTLVYWVWMAVAVIGLIAWLKRPLRFSGSLSWLALPLVYIVYNSLVFFFFPAWDRFRYPIMPAWAVFFGLGCAALYHRWRAARHEAVSDMLYSNLNALKGAVADAQRDCHD